MIRVSLYCNSRGRVGKSVFRDACDDDDDDVVDTEVVVFVGDAAEVVDDIDFLIFVDDESIDDEVRR